MRENLFIENNRNVVLRYGMGSDFVTFSMHFLNRRIVCVFVWHKKCRLNWTAIRVIPTLFEDLLIDINVIVIDGVVEWYHNHLGNVCRLQFAGDLGPIRWTETVRQNALTLVTGRSSVRVLFNSFQLRKKLIVLQLFLRPNNDSKQMQ